MRRRARGFDRFGLKTGRAGLTGLGLKIGDGLGVVKVQVEGTWRYRKACVETERSREGGVFVRGFYKNLDRFALAWVCIVVNSVGVFLSFAGTTYC